MHRNITVILGLLLVACSAPVRSQEAVFYDDFESGDLSGWWAPARVGETGQKTCYDDEGTVVSCTGTTQDGDLLTGVAWPSPRFVDNGDGTVTDILTGLIWLKDSTCADLSGTDTDGRTNWTTALMASTMLVSGVCGLDDGSVVGDWRLPNINELQSLTNFEYFDPALSDTAGTAKWSEGDPFSGVSSSIYWSSSSSAFSPSHAWKADIAFGLVLATGIKTENHFLWPVRGGR